MISGYEVKIWAQDLALFGDGLRELFLKSCKLLDRSYLTYKK